MKRKKRMEKYYSINVDYYDNISVITNWEMYTSIDELNFMLGNYYETREEAEEQLKTKKENLERGEF